MSQMLAAALDYLSRGWPVVPAWGLRGAACECGDITCTSQGKHPRRGWKKYQAQMPTEAEVRAWWRDAPNANVLIVTGRLLGAVVVDVDPRHGGDDSAYELEKAGHLPSTLTCITGGGGRHLYYAHPGEAIPNAAGLAQGIDFRGDGGYVVAPPSAHTSGRVYAWDVGEPETFTPLPEHIAGLIRSSHRIGVDGATRAPFDAERILVEPINQGMRNDRLAQIAGHFIGQGLPFHAVQAALLGMNGELCRPPLDAAEVKKIADSIWRIDQEGRQATDEIAHRLNGAAEMAGPIPPTDQTIMARKMWEELGVKEVGDWYIIRGESSEYVLVAGGDEARLGDDLMNQNALRRRLLNELGVMLKPIEAKVAWPKRALLLRQVAREEHAESTIAEHRVDEWLESIATEQGVTFDPPPAERGAFLRSRPIVVAGRIHLKPPILLRYLDHSMGERMTMEALHKVLKRAGWDSKARCAIQNDAGAPSTTATWSHAYTRDAS